jgi:hypothetical protein
VRVATGSSRRPRTSCHLSRSSSSLPCGTSAPPRLGVRDYDGEVGRWRANDPLRFDGGAANLVQYSGGDPVNRKDPTGLLSLQCLESIAVRSPQWLRPGTRSLRVTRWAKFTC